MSRRIVGKIKVKGTLVAQTPISVGGIGGGEHVDLELAEDGTGRCYVPGTSLAGPMRAWLMARLPRDGRPEDHPMIRALFGYVDRDSGQASSLFVHDSPIEDDQGNVRRERRHGIAIDGRTGTAKEGSFYARALLPMGTRLPLEMELDIFSENDPAPGALARILDALEKEEIRFGAAKTRGMGRMKLEGLTVDYYDFVGDDKALGHWLEGKASERRGLETLAGFKKNMPKLGASQAFTIRIKWRAKSPLMVKAGRDGVETDMLPLMSGVGGGNVAPVIPGSSIKGALRAQARRILNTLFDPPAPQKGDEERWSILADLFGSKERAGRLRVDDVYHDTSISSEAQLGEDVDAMNGITERRQHVAIDRFTGGASEGALYSARPVRRGTGWGPIVLGLDASNAVSEANTLKELALLRLLVRDMRAGYLPIGFGTRRGLGEVDVKDVAYSDGFPSDSDLQSAWDDFVASEGTSFDVQDEGRSQG